MFNLKAEIYLRIIFLISLIALISAYFIEHVLEHQPCNLCLIERIPYGLSIILISLMFIIKKNENVGLTEKSSFYWEIPSQIEFFTENLI